MTVLWKHSRSWAVWLATGLGVGYGPVMPATYGSALGVGLYLILAELLRSLPHAPWLLLLTSVVLVGVSVAVIAIALPGCKGQDPREVVLDEVAGQFITLIPLPLVSQRRASDWVALGIGFLLFRVLDVVKPYPIRKLERLKGAWGVVADDVGAGMVAALLLAGLARLGWIL